VCLTAVKAASFDEEMRAMNLEPLRSSKMARFVRYGALALIVTWTLLALAIYAALDLATDWMASIPAADGWVA